MRTTLVVLCLIATPALAQSQDRDGDGRITREEMRDDDLRRFAGVDQDGNGQLNRDELAAASFDVEAWMSVDTNRDGGVDAQEHQTVVQTRQILFNYCDVNHDGVLTSEEFACLR